MTIPTLSKGAVGAWLVLIHLLMEHGLRDGNIINATKIILEVLILLLMEYGLRGYKKIGAGCGEAKS